MRRALASAALAALACAATNLPPRTTPDVALEDEERGLWSLAAEGEERLARSGHLLSDAALETYLLEVARRLEPPAAFAAIPFRIRILREPTPNAFCMPNGAIFLHTGLLARMESEAELAVLLGHEMTHATHRHALRQLRSASNTGALVSVLGGGGQSLFQLAAVSGYRRDLEREADRVGLDRAGAAGYDLGEAVKLYERLRDWALEEKLPPDAGFFSSHPRMQERIDSSREIVAAMAASGGARQGPTYAERTAAVLLENARLDLAAGRYPPARAEVIRYLALRERDAAGHVALGEIARREGAPGHEEAALKSYRRAAELAPGSAEAWRGIGLVLQRKGEKAEARRAFARYLELAPEAPDRAHVRSYLDAPGGGKP